MLIKKAAKTIYNYLPYYFTAKKQYREYYKIAQSNEFISRDEFDRIQLKRLKTILEYSYKYVPYYHELFKKIQFDPFQFCDFEQLQDLPILNKRTVQLNRDKFVSTAIPRKQIGTIYSGGSTGVPAEYKRQKNDGAIERAFMHLQWNRVGFDHKKRQSMALLRGIKPTKGNYEISNGRLIFSSYIADDSIFDEYLDVLEKFNPDFIHAYPSIIYLWAKHLLKNNIELSLTKLSAIFLGSENLFDFQRADIELAFKTRIFSWYGHTERRCLAGECEQSTHYHIFPDYGYAELAGEYNENSEKEGKLIVTSFLNKAMPLIRFNTEDIVTMSNDICSCGRGHRLIKKVHGRSNEYLIDAKGLIIPANVLLPYELISLFDEVIQYQFKQKEVGKTIFIMKVSDHFEEHHMQKIKDELRKELGENMLITIEIVDSIPRTEMGKLSFLNVSNRT
ncbi:MAG: hypothetical protein PHC50_01780 [Candidatus Cloacimonetes bacterium]|nr:hypothetical protein [Candidatus Cloacimonadota bacterium]